MSEPKVLSAEELDDLRGPYMHMGIEYRASLWCSYSGRLLATIDAQQKVIDAARDVWNAFEESLPISLEILGEELAALDKEMEP